MYHPVGNEGSVTSLETDHRKIQEGLLIFEIPTEFQCNGGALEYCLAGGLPCRIAPGDAVEPSDRVRTPRVCIGRLP